MQSYQHALRHFKLLNITALSLVGLSITGFTACGKRKPPLPPVERVSQRAEISGVQRGDRVFLNWTLAPRNAAASDLNNISRVDIYRLAERAGESSNLTEDEFASRGTLIATVDVTPADFARRSMNFADRLDFAGQAARLRYAVRFANAAGQKAGFSNFATIEPTAGVAERPAAILVRPSQNSLQLTWRRPTTNIDGSAPPNIIGFNIYRSEADGRPRLLNKTPANGEEYQDRMFEFGKTYDFYVRTVSLGGSGQPIESADSETFRITPRDVFAPAPPTALTIAAAPTAMSVFFASNTETDIAGYKVYRSGDSTLPRSQWTLLTPEPIKSNTFQDSSVVPGRTYFYYVVAIDTAGNISDGSEIVGDTVP